MPDIYISPLTKDLVISNGVIRLGTIPEDAAQRVVDDLSTFAGEWFLDTTYGALNQTIFQLTNPNLSVIGNLFKIAIVQAANNNIPNGFAAVLTAFSLSLNAHTRTLSLSCSIAIGTIVVPINIILNG